MYLNTQYMEWQNFLWCLWRAPWWWVLKAGTLAVWWWGYSTIDHSKDVPHTCMVQCGRCPPKFFVPQGQPSSPDNRSYRKKCKPNGLLCLILCKLLAYFVRDIWLDVLSTGIFCSTRSTLIMWWQVHQCILFQKVHPHHAMTGPPSSQHDDRSTGNFCSERSTLITGWQLHRNLLFSKVHPHHVMTCQFSDLSNNILASGSPTFKICSLLLCGMKRLWWWRDACIHTSSLWIYKCRGVWRDCSDLLKWYLGICRSNFQALQLFCGMKRLKR